MRKNVMWICFLLAAACGGDDGPSGGDGDGMPDASAEPSTFECGGEECEAGAEYCLESLVNGVPAVVECVELPPGCSGCDCAQDDAPNQFPTSNNCDALITCSQTNEEITVTCRQTL